MYDLELPAMSVTLGMLGVGVESVDMSVICSVYDSMTPLGIEGGSHVMLTLVEVSLAYSRLKGSDGTVYYVRINRETIILVLAWVVPIFLKALCEVLHTCIRILMIILTAKQSTINYVGHCL